MSAKKLVDSQSGLKFVKCPLWIDQHLFFLDIHDSCVKSVDLRGTVEFLRVLPYVPSSFVVLADGGFVVGDAWCRKMYRLEGAGQKPLADLSDIAANCLSDGVADGDGGMYVGDVGFDYLDPLADRSPDGLIVHVSRKGTLSVVADGLFFPSGMVVTPNNETLIVAESLNHRLIALDIKKDGSLQNGRVWAQFGDDISPEGICLDADGAIWIAGAGSRALRVMEGGKIDHQIITERPVFATTLGGPQRRHLFLCTSESNDPVITRQFSGAAIEISEVAVPGVRLS